MGPLVDAVRSELAHLQGLAERLVAARPALQGLLGRGGDAGVARLWEGAAFAFGRVREELEAELPELVVPLAAALAPELLGGMPSHTVLELAPAGPLDGPRWVDTGALYATSPREGAPCLFRTTAPCLVRPWRLAEVRRLGADGRTLRFAFAVQPGARLDESEGAGVALFFAGELAQALALRAHLLEHGAAVRWVAGRRAAAVARLRSPRFAAAHAEEADGGAGSGGVFTAFDALRRVFAFPHGAAFVEVPLAGATDLFAAGGDLALEIDLAEPLPRGVAVDAEVVRLHCAPASNVYPGPRLVVPARPLPALALLPVREGAELHGVESVHLATPHDAARPRVLPFAPASFIGGGPEGPGALEARAARLYYELRRCAAADGRRVDVSIGITSLQGPPPLHEGDELHVQASCTDGLRAAHLGVGDVCHETASSPDYVVARNVVPPSAPLPSALAGGRLLEVLSLAGASSWDAAARPALARLLALANGPAFYRLPGSAPGPDELEGLVATAARRVDVLDGELVRSGLRVDLAFRLSPSGGGGEARLVAEAVATLLRALTPRREHLEVRASGDDAALYASGRRRGDRDAL